MNFCTAAAELKNSRFLANDIRNLLKQIGSIKSQKRKIGSLERFLHSMEDLFELSLINLPSRIEWRPFLTRKMLNGFPLY